MFLEAYDYVCLMAMPYMEQAEKPKVWMETLVEKVAAQTDGLERTVFMLQSRNWLKPDQFVPSTEIAATMRRLQRRGALNFGYYPDDFHINQPQAEVIHPAFSLQTYPYRP